MNILYIAVLFMLGCNVDVFGITSKLKEHIDLIQLRKRRVFWSASSVITPLLGDQSCWANGVDESFWSFLSKTSKLYWYGSLSIQMPTQLASTVVRRNEWATHCIMLAAAKVQWILYYHQLMRCLPWSAEVVVSRGLLLHVDRANGGEYDHHAHVAAVNSS